MASRPFYAGAIRDGLSIFFRCTDTPPALPNYKYSEELLDAYIRVEDITALYRELSRRGAVLFRDIDDRPWGFTEFVVKDREGRLLCFGHTAETIDGSADREG